MRINIIREYGVISGDDRSDSINNESHTRSEKTRYI